MRLWVCGLVLLFSWFLAASAQEPAPLVSDEPAGFQFPAPDWNNRRTWVKAALLAGAAVLVKLSFRKMKEDESRDEE
jgi:hypothetical protein